MESKSLKLYLGSFAMSRFDGEDAVRTLLRADIGACVGADIVVSVEPLRAHAGDATATLPGTTLDDQSTDCDAFEVDKVRILRKGLVF